MYKSAEKLNLGSLLRGIKSDVECICGDIDTQVNSIEYNSRKVSNGALFIAIQGFVTDGHNYIKNAVDKGAKAVLISRDRIQDFIDLQNKDIIILASDDTRKALSNISAAFFDYPTSKVIVVGITGTNGKTSITYMIESILKEHGLYPGVVGTVNYRWKDKSIQSSNTTPESRDLQEIFANMIADGVNALIIEVSSHALKLFRVDDIDFDIAAFTNLTRDHMDFHDSFEDYFQSKKKLFRLLGKSRKHNKSAIINCDDEYGKKILDNKSEFSYPVFSFGMSPGADFKIDSNSIDSSVDGLSYFLENQDEKINIKLNVIGNFQISNSLCACAVCYRMGIPVSVIQKGLAGLKEIPGRFDSIRSGIGFTVIIDYAHTDDAVSKLLNSARELGSKRILTLLGCGGNRDKTKRPIMGKTAVSNSDWVIFTSDNPRDEDPDEIIRDIISGLNEDNFETITDRNSAIRKAVYMAEKDDIIVIAGKGHEDYQDVRGTRIHFDDHEIAKKYILERESH